MEVMHCFLIGIVGEDATALGQGAIEIAQGLEMHLGQRFMGQQP
mgnify:CR=1 FL=1